MKTVTTKMEMKTKHLYYFQNVYRDMSTASRPGEEEQEDQTKKNFIPFLEFLGAQSVITGLSNCWKVFSIHIQWVGVWRLFPLD